MKTLFEIIINLILAAIIIMNLPAIAGFISLCMVIACVFFIVKDTFAGADTKDTVSTNQSGTHNMQHIKSECQTKQNEQKIESKTANNSGQSYSRGYSRPHYSDYDAYDTGYDSYYDDRQYDMPPEEGDGWQGTGNPFV